MVSLRLSRLLRLSRGGIPFRASLASKFSTTGGDAGTGQDTVGFYQKQNLCNLGAADVGLAEVTFRILLPSNTLPQFETEVQPGYRSIKLLPVVYCMFLIPLL